MAYTNRENVEESRDIVLNSKVEDAYKIDVDKHLRNLLKAQKRYLKHKDKELGLPR